MGSRRHARSAVLLLLVWTLGVEVLPGLHLALHDLLAEHTHEGDARTGSWRTVPSKRQVVATSSPHRHDDGTLHHHGDREENDSPRDDRHAGHPHEHDGQPAPNPDHGTNSLAHKHLAWLAPAPPPTPPSATAIDTLAYVRTPTAAPTSRWRRPTRARGPPATI